MLIQWQASIHCQYHDIWYLRCACICVLVCILYYVYIVCILYKSKFLFMCECLYLCVWDSWICQSGNGVSLLNGILTFVVNFNARSIPSKIISATIQLMSALGNNFPECLIPKVKDGSSNSVTTMSQSGMLAKTLYVPLTQRLSVLHRKF